MEKSCRENGTLMLAFIAGLSINGAFTALFSSAVPFSIFPLIALALAVYCLHQRYLNQPMSDGIPKLVAACFLLGILAFSAYVRAEYPQMGSNFLPALICVALVFWISLKLKARKAQVERSLQ
ncbi:YijD family membrane protein [Serratia sp. UGAL515B_01]|uniref:YijD family membrane protein n=1 Tax=Serratia sp. UGAL515B_01 TaxID=2986763 RepID=UPI002952D77D|nr:YijD family membrane protein [Serratia sp. UGAL515B_01]WON76833.1 YijD family membrane protein [Serratia sp. UGAL515B_01]